MAETFARMVLYGLIAAASPLALTATIVALRSQRARVNGAIFAVAFLLGGLAAVVAVTAIGAAAAPGSGGSRKAASVLEFVLGVLLLIAAARVRRSASVAATAGRTGAVLDRLARLKPASAFSAGALLGIGGPKRLTISIVAATTISGSGLSAAEGFAAAVLYVVVASVLVWVPVLMYLLAGSRARAWLDDGQRWLMANQATFATTSLVLFGVLLVIDALVALL